MEIDVRALLLLLCGAVLFLVLLIIFRKPRGESYFDFSDLNLFPEVRKSWKQRYIHLPQLLWRLSFICLVIAFIDPRIEKKLSQDPQVTSKDDIEEKKHEELSLPTEGVAIYLVLDQSGSMAQEMVFIDPEGRQRLVSRMDVLKQMTNKFIAGRSEDLMGLVAFARVPQVLVPLTLDHTVVLEHLAEMHPIREDKGNGTAIGYALFKTVNLIQALSHFANKLPEPGKPAYTIMSTVIVLVTDGIQEPNPLDKGHVLRNMDLKSATLDAVKEGIRIYVVNLNSEIANPYYRRALVELQGVAEKTGGKFYLADQPEALAKIYAEIDLVEKATFSQQKKVSAEVHEHVEQHAPLRSQWIFFPYFTFLGATFLCASVVLSSTLLRRVP